jgi:hypothetical protein
MKVAFSSFEVHFLGVIDIGDVFGGGSTWKR